MHFSTLVYAPLLVTSATAQVLSFFSDTACQELNPTDYFSVACGYACTNIDGYTDHSVNAVALEPNQQVLLWTGRDCEGDAYAAIGQAYASSVGIGECAANCDGYGSFMVQVYDNDGGGEACPAGTLTAAPTTYPTPSNTSC